VTEQVFHAIRHADGGTATSAEEIADAFKCHYQRLGNEAIFCAANPQFDASARHDISCEVQMHLLESLTQDAACPLDAPLTADEIQACVNRLKHNKAGNPAEEGIVNELLMYGGPAMISMLHSYCSLMWHLEQVHHVPGTIISLPKTGDLSDPVNYRGITLLSVLYKLYTSVLNRRLIEFAEEQQYVQQQQQQEAQQQEAQQQPTANRTQPCQQQQQQQHAVLPQQQQRCHQQQQQVHTLAPTCSKTAYMCQVVSQLFRGQLTFSSIPGTVSTCLRGIHRQAVNLIRSCARAFTGIFKRTSQVQQQQQPHVVHQSLHIEQHQPQHQQTVRQVVAPTSPSPPQHPPSPKPLLHECQNGFRPKRSCADHQFVLYQTLTSRQQAKQDSYVLFVDTYKAFPTVWLDGLFHKLWEKGVRGKMLRVLYNLYQGAQRVVSHDGVVTGAFTSNVGLHEGDVISPTLYLYFIDDLLREVWAKHPGVTLIGPGGGTSTQVVAAMQADDFVAVCDSIEEARAVAETVYQYSMKWLFRLNAKKSAIMHVAPSSRQQSCVTSSGITWNGVNVPVVDRYCYLGLWFQNNCSWNVHFEEVMKKVERRKNMLMPVWKSRHISVEVKRIVLLTCVRPIFEYAAEVWAPTTKQKWAAIDRVQTDIIKCAMRVGHERPCTHAVLAEWGVKPMHMWMHARAMEYFFRVQRMSDERLPKKVLDAVWVLPDHVGVSVLPWQKYVSCLLQQYSVGSDTAFDDAEKCKSHVKKQIKLRYADMVTRDMPVLSSLQRYVQHVSPNLLQHMSFSAPQPYLCGVHPSFGFELLMRVRLGCLSVHEHTSRFARRHITEGTDEDVESQAPCPACGAPVESIAHFMFECPVSASARTHMYDIIKTSVNGESKLQKCLGLSCGKTMVARFVSCDFWNDKRAIVHNAIAMFLQKAWRIRNAYKHGLADIDVVDGVISASMRRGADGIDARA
jgi:hypothetical protein